MEKYTNILQIKCPECGLFVTSKVSYSNKIPCCYDCCARRDPDFSVVLTERGVLRVELSKRGKARYGLKP